MHFLDDILTIRARSTFTRQLMPHTPGTGMNDDFEAMSRLSAEDGDARLSARIERERRVQTRARRIRMTCRVIALVGGLSVMGCMFMIGRGSSFAFEGLACFLMLPTMLALITLFFMGGLAPNTLRGKMSKRQRDLLDN